MYYIDDHGNPVQISEADQRWLNDSWFHTQQLKLPTEAPRAALTYRVSTKGQVDHDDIPLQKIECRKFAQNHGWRVVAEAAEKDISGSKVSASKRDVIQKLREEAEKKNFDILLVYMFDRLGRIDSETPFVLEWFVNHGVQMWSTHEGQQRIENHADKLMIKEQCPITAVAGTLGHATPATTTTIYAHALQRASAKTANVMQNLFEKKKIS